MTVPSFRRHRGAPALSLHSVASVRRVDGRRRSSGAACGHPKPRKHEVHKGWKNRRPAAHPSEEDADDLRDLRGGSSGAIGLSHQLIHRLPPLARGRVLRRPAGKPPDLCVRDPQRPRHRLPEATGQRSHPLRRQSSAPATPSIDRQRHRPAADESSARCRRRCRCPMRAFSAATTADAASS